MKQNMIGDVPGNVLGMLSDLTSKLQHGKITSRQFELFLKGKNPFVGEDDILAEWTTLYCDYLGLTVDLSGVKIPEHKNGFDRIIIVARELLMASNGRPYTHVIEAMKKHFPVWTYSDDLNKVIVKNDRWPDKSSYTVRFRDRVEADEELKNRSADDLAKDGISGITCLERLLYELKYFAETGKNLDIDNWTLCSGSRCSAGSVPGVDFGGGGVRVGWCPSSGARSRLRSRSVAV